MQGVDLPKRATSLVPRGAFIDIDELVARYLKRKKGHYTRAGISKPYQKADWGPMPEGPDIQPPQNFAEDIEHFILKAPFVASVFGAGFQGGQPREGVEDAPDKLRDTGLDSALAQLGWKIKDRGNVKLLDLDEASDPEVAQVRAPLRTSAGCKQTYEAVKEAALAGEFALTLGGDHSCAIGSIAGSTAAYPDLGVIWVDAHADLNTPQLSPTGNLHGMPAAFLMGLAPVDDIPGFSEWFKPCLNPEKIVYVGLRDVDLFEKKLLRKLGIKAFSMHEVDRFGIGKVMKLAMDHIDPLRRTPIHLSFDIDGIDPSIAPSTGTPVLGGLTFREAAFICEDIAQAGTLVAMDVVEVNPHLGDDEQKSLTMSVALGLIRSALGQKLI